MTVSHLSKFVLLATVVAALTAIGCAADPAHRSPVENGSMSEAPGRGGELDSAAVKPPTSPIWCQAPELQADDVVYVVDTSGSTGWYGGKLEIAQLLGRSLDALEPHQRFTIRTSTQGALSPTLIAASVENKLTAQLWLQSLRPVSGGSARALDGVEVAFDNRGHRSKALVLVWDDHETPLQQFVKHLEPYGSRNLRLVMVNARARQGFARVADHFGATWISIP